MGEKKMSQIVEGYNINEEYLYNKTYLFIKGFATGRNFKLILGSDAFKHFTKNEYIQKILDLRNFNIGNYSPGDAQKNGKYKGVAYVGALTIAGVGTINIYTYNYYFSREL